MARDFAERGSFLLSARQGRSHMAASAVLEGAVLSALVPDDRCFDGGITAYTDTSLAGLLGPDRLQSALGGQTARRQMGGGRAGCPKGLMQVILRWRGVSTQMPPPPSPQTWSYRSAVVQSIAATTGLGLGGRGVRVNR